MKLSRSGLLVLACAGVLVTSTTALAGYHTSQQVIIDDTQKLATGYLGDARNSSDSNQYIGCLSDSNLSGTCYAENSAGTSRSCYTGDTYLISVIRSVKGDSNLYFKWDANGNCVYIRVDTDSSGQPKG